MHPEVLQSELKTSTTYYALSQRPDFSPEIPLWKTTAFYIRVVLAVFSAAAYAFIGIMRWDYDLSAKLLLCCSGWIVGEVMTYLVDISTVRRALPRIVGRDGAMIVVFALTSSKSAKTTTSYLTGDQIIPKDGRERTPGEILALALPAFKKDVEEDGYDLRRFRMHHVPSETIGSDPRETAATFGVYEEGDEIVTVLGVCSRNVIDVIRFVYIGGASSHATLTEGAEEADGD